MTKSEREKYQAIIKQKKAKEAEALKAKNKEKRQKAAIKKAEAERKKKELIRQKKEKARASKAKAAKSMAARATARRHRLPLPACYTKLSLPVKDAKRLMKDIKILDKREQYQEKSKYSKQAEELKTMVATGQDKDLVSEEQEPTEQDIETEQEIEMITVCANYSMDPLSWVLWAFDWGHGELTDCKGPEQWQVEVLTDLRDGLIDFKQALKIAVASGHGIGKSALVAWLILWAMSTCEDCKGVVTANTENQLKTKTWAELGKWHRLCITKSWFNFTATAIYSTDKTHEKTWRIDMVPWSENNTEAFAGLHNKGKRIIVIFDEASAIPDMIHQVTEGALTDSDTQIMWLQFGNPTRNVGRFFQCFGVLRHRWITHKVDSRSVSFTNKEQIKQWEEDYGADSDFFRVRVKGEFPMAASGQFIPLDIVDDALGKHLKSERYDFAPKIIGVDCARYGDDRSVIFKRQGLASFTPQAFSGIDTAALADKVAVEIVEWNPDAVMIDVGAMGAGVVDILRRAGHRVIEVNFGSASADPSCNNKRTEMWKHLREWLKAGGAIPNLSALKDDLIGPEYTYDNKTRFVLESKKHMKERGIASPDYADALAVTFAMPVSSSSFTLKARPDNKQAILSKRRLRRGKR